MEDIDKIRELNTRASKIPSDTRKEVSLETLEEIIKERSIYYKNPTTEVCSYRILTTGEYSLLNVAKAIKARLEIKPEETK